MSSRERWTIYPLLFLALGAALRGKVTSTFDVNSLSARRMESVLVKAAQVSAPSMQSEEIVARRIVILGHDGKPRLQFGSTRADTGEIEIYGREGRLLANLGADPTTRAGILKLQTAEGRPLVVLHAGQHGGAVDTLDPESGVIVELGAQAGQAGVFVNDPNVRLAPRRPRAPPTQPE